MAPSGAGAVSGRRGGSVRPLQITQMVFDQSALCLVVEVLGQQFGRRLDREVHGLATQLGACDGDLIEIVTPQGAAALRGWARLEGVEPDLGLDRSALLVLGANPGDAVEIRCVPNAPR